MKDENKDLDDVLHDSLDDDLDDLDSVDDYQDPDAYDDEDEDEDEDDIDSEEEDEEDDEPKKGGIAGKVLLGVGALGLVAAGGFVALQTGVIGGSSSNDSIMGASDPIGDPLPIDEGSSNAMIMEPSTEDEGLLFLDDETSASEATNNADESALVSGTQETPVSTQLNIANTEATPSPINEEELIKKAVDKANNEIINSKELTEAIKQSSLTEDQVQKIALSVAKNQISKISIPESNVDLSDIDAVSSQTLESKLLDMKKDILEEIAKENQRLTKKEVDKVLDGRTRLKGFVVINKSTDGKMAIVKTPMKRINVYYKGERFMTEGRWVKVSGIEDSGHIVLVEDKYYIDEVEEKPVVKKSTSKAKAKKKPVKPKEVKKKETVKTKVNPENVESRQYRAETINGKKVAIGYSKNGEYGSGYLVKTSSGDWTTVTKGSIIEGLGKVIGVDIDQNLIVGEYIILNDKK